MVTDGRPSPFHLLHRPTQPRAVQRRSRDEQRLVQVIGLTYTLAFALELLLRLVVDGCSGLTSCHVGSAVRIQNSSRVEVMVQIQIRQSWHQISTGQNCVLPSQATDLYVAPSTSHQTRT